MMCFGLQTTPFYSPELEVWNQGGSLAQEWKQRNCKNNFPFCEHANTKVLKPLEILGNLRRGFRRAAKGTFGTVGAVGAQGRRRGGRRKAEGGEGDRSEAPAEVLGLGPTVV